MKRLLLALIALTVATAFTAPAFAGILDAKNKAGCEKAGGVWVEKDHKCGAKKQQATEGASVGGLPPQDN